MFPPEMPTASHLRAVPKKSGHVPDYTEYFQDGKGKRKTPGPTTSLLPGPRLYYFCGFCFQSINEWTTENVLEWLAAVNMYDHVEVFKTKAIKGCDLPNLDRDKLEVSRIVLAFRGS